MGLHIDVLAPSKRVGGCQSEPWPPGSSQGPQCLPHTSRAQKVQDDSEEQSLLRPVPSRDVLRLQGRQQFDVLRLTRVADSSTP